MFFLLVCGAKVVLFFDTFRIAGYIPIFRDEITKGVNIRKTG